MPPACWPLQDQLAPKDGIRPTLPEICQRLHEMSTGAADWDWEYYQKAYIILTMARLGWIENPENPEKTRAYDDAVLKLVEATLDEATMRSA